MLKRYTKKEMGEIWEDATTYEIQLQIEIAVCEAWAELGKIPKEVVEDIKKKAYICSERIEEIEKDVKHNIIAFLTCLSESVGENSKYIHMGLTSSDILDTTLSIQAVRASRLLMDKLRELMSEIKEQAFIHKNTIMMGRSHGMHGEPITLGLKLANWYSEMKRNERRLLDAKNMMKVGKISGSMGTYAHIPAELELMVCSKLGLESAAISNQILQRDRHAQFITTLAIIGSSLEKFATEIRHLARTEIHELEEPFTENQKGSSSMPHKRNPIRSENICGCSRVLRGYALTAMENIALWHERDISHSSAERIIFPDATILLYHMINKMINIVKNMVVYPDRMKKNIELSGRVFLSQKVVLDLVEKGFMNKENAYKFVQSVSMEALDSGEDFMEVFRRRVEINPEIEIDEKDYIKNIDYTFRRVFGDPLSFFDRRSYLGDSLNYEIEEDSCESD